MKKKKRRSATTEERLQLYRELEQGTLALEETVQRMRKMIGLTQSEYANLIGIAPRVLMNLERGIGNPTLDTLKKISKPFGLTVVFRKISQTKGPTT
jgi:transcriptional regulator with XRE-family HTH domain